MSGTDLCLSGPIDRLVSVGERDIEEEEISIIEIWAQQCSSL